MAIAIQSKSEWRSVAAALPPKSHSVTAPIRRLVSRPPRRPFPDRPKKSPNGYEIGIWRGSFNKSDRSRRLLTPERELRLREWQCFRPKEIRTESRAYPQLTSQPSTKRGDLLAAFVDFDRPKMDEMVG